MSQDSRSNTRNQGFRFTNSVGSDSLSASAVASAQTSSSTNTHQPPSQQPHHHQQHPHHQNSSSSNIAPPPQMSNPTATNTSSESTLQATSCTAPNNNNNNQSNTCPSSNQTHSSSTTSQSTIVNPPDLITILAHPGYLPPDQNEQAQPPEIEIAYSDLRTIGNGSFGVVFQATLQRPTQEQIAIKKVLQDKRYKNRELQIMRKLDHCNVVKLKYFFHTMGERNNSEVYLHLVLEYIPETLYKIARVHNRNRQPLPMLYVKLYMYQLFRSLNYIHSMDICHRDIKPQNLLLNPETAVLKLCDFGSAKSLVVNEPNVAYICSRYYRAPELIFAATNYTTKIDIWSAGCVMAELILGETMFPGGNPVDQLVEIIKVLGTPSRDQLKAMNPNYTEFRFPQIKPRSWTRIFSSQLKTPPEAAKLVSNLLEYTPSNRLSPLAACAHPFFDELRSSTTPQRLANGREFPPLFNFSPDELKKEPHLVGALMPANIKTSPSTSDAAGSLTATGSASTSNSTITNNNNNNSNILSSSATTTQQSMTSNNSNLNNDDTSISSVTGGSRQAPPPPPNSHHQQQQQQQSSQAHHGSKSSNTV